MKNSNSCETFAGTCLHWYSTAVWSGNEPRRKKGRPRSNTPLSSRNIADRCKSPLSRVAGSVQHTLMHRKNQRRWSNSVVDFEFGNLLKRALQSSSFAYLSGTKGLWKEIEVTHFPCKGGRTRLQHVFVTNYDPCVDGIGKFSCFDYFSHLLVYSYITIHDICMFA